MIVVNSREGLQELMDGLVQTGSEYGLELNTNKTRQNTCRYYQERPKRACNLYIKMNFQEQFCSQ